jgi:predicted nucleic acid-binding Zn ribbon protein
MGGEPTRLGEVLVAALARLPGGRDLADYAVWLHWEDVLGPLLAPHAHPRRLRRGVLVVDVDDSTWMQEMHLLKTELCARLNARLGRPAVRDIFLVLGEPRRHPA